MPRDERTLTVVREWVVKAENDLRNASFVLTMQRDCPTDTVCFHAQQCVEKYLKAMLTLRDMPHPATHDMDLLVSLLPPVDRPGLEAMEWDRLTEYATVTRYPGGYEPIPLEEARSAVDLAERVRAQVREILPPEALVL